MSRECRCSEWPLSLGDTWSCGCPMVAAFLGLNTSASRCFLHFKPAFFQKRKTPGFDTLCHISHTACGQCAGCLHPEPTSPGPPAFSFHPRERPTITGCSASPGRDGSPMNFPLGCPWPPLPGHGRGNHPFFHVRRHAGRKRLETAPKGRSKSGRKAARSSDRRWAIVCLGGQPGFLRPCLKAENIHVYLIFSSALSLRGCRGLRALHVAGACTAAAARSRRHCCVCSDGGFPPGFLPHVVLPCWGWLLGGGMGLLGMGGCVLCRLGSTQGSAALGTVLL